MFMETQWGSTPESFIQKLNDWFQKFKALKSKFVKKAQFHKENGIKK